LEEEKSRKEQRDVELGH